MDENEQIKLLIEIILDKQGDESERQDALFYLRDHGSLEIENALLRIINDINDDYDMRRDACETLAEVWNNQNKCRPILLNNMDKYLADDIKMFTLALRPDWKKYFDNL